VLHAEVETGRHIVEVRPKGEGVPKSEVDAVTWFEQAAAQGQQMAREELDRRRGE
jgi:hypothetical protein